MFDTATEFDLFGYNDAMSSQMTKTDLVRLVEHIMSASGCIMDLDSLLNQFEANVEYPNASELIFNPPGGKTLSATEIVEIATRKQNRK